MTVDPKDLRKLADDHESAIYGGNGVPAGEALKAPKALRQAADEIERLRVIVHAGRKAGAAIRALQLEIASLRTAFESTERKHRADTADLSAEVDAARRVVEAANGWLEKSRHLPGCPFHPLGAACTCGLGDLDSALFAYDDLKQEAEDS